MQHITVDHYCFFFPAYKNLVANGISACDQIEWFLGEELLSPAPRLQPAAVRRTATLVASELPADVLTLIVQQAWLSDPTAPRLAAVDHSFYLANERAAFELQGTDVRPPRADVTVPPCSSIDPRAGVDVAKFREEYCAWGMALAHYAEFRVTMPSASVDSAVGWLHLSRRATWPTSSTSAHTRDSSITS